MEKIHSDTTSDWKIESEVVSPTRILLVGSPALVPRPQTPQKAQRQLVPAPTLHTLLTFHHKSYIIYRGISRIP
jgi:hypothetical protein